MLIFIITESNTLLQENLEFKSKLSRRAKLAQIAVIRSTKLKLLNSLFSMRKDKLKEISCDQSKKLSISSLQLSTKSLMRHLG